MFSVSAKKVFPIVSTSMRSMGSLSFEAVGIPSTVLKLNPAVIKAAAPSFNEVAVKVNVSPVSAEDVRRIHGVSIANPTTGVGGTTAVGTVTAVPSGESSLKVNDLVLITDANSWADEVVVSKNDVVKVPNLSIEDAASLPAIVSAIGIFNLLPGLKTGDIVLQTEGETALGQAIAQYGKTLGVTVVATTAMELADINYIASMKSKGRVAHAITGSAGKANTLLLKIIPHSGVLVAHNGIYQPIGKTVGIDVPISRAIFQDVQIIGFDYFGFKRYSSAAFHAAMTKAIELVGSKQVVLKGNVHAVKDYITAVTEVEKTGKFNMLTF